jgi:hypothetical protein
VSIWLVYAILGLGFLWAWAGLGPISPKVP